MELIIVIEGDYFYIDSTGYRTEITFAGAIDIMTAWECNNREIHERTVFSGLVTQYWVY